MYEYLVESNCQKSDSNASNFFAIDQETITPNDLKTKAIWVGWCSEERNGVLTKVPYNARTNGKAMADNSSTWGTYTDVENWAENYCDPDSDAMFGPGLQLAEIPGSNFHLAGIDLDTCRDDATGVIEPWANEIIVRFASYTEISPSWTGVKIYFLYHMDDSPTIAALFDNKCGALFKKQSDNWHPPAIEVYRSNRFFAFTQEKLESSPDELRVVRPLDFEWLLEIAGPKFKDSATETKTKSSGDKSNSAKAFRMGGKLKWEGKTYEEMRDALLDSDDDGIAGWAKTKGMLNSEREMRRIFDKANTQEKTDGRFVNVKGVSKKVTTIDDLNKRFALLEVRYEPSVYVSRTDYLPISDKDLDRRLEGEVVHMGQDFQEQAKYLPAALAWKGSGKKHVYRQIAFTNKNVAEDTFNLFRGLGVTPKAGPCELIKQHIREVICSGDEKSYEAMLSLMAWQLQNIGKPSRVIVVLHNPIQQCGGKGTICEKVLLEIYGPSGISPSSTEQVLGKHVDALRGRPFVFLDEIVFHGDHRTANRLKALSTAKLMGIESKYLATVQYPVAVNFWLASNAETPVHIEDGDARYWIIKVSEHRKKEDNAYWSALYDEIENGGREAFAQFLLDRDVKDFMPSRDVPKTNAVRDAAIIDCLNPYDARVWLLECATFETMSGLSRFQLVDQRTCFAIRCHP